MSVHSDDDGSVQLLESVSSLDANDGKEEEDDFGDFLDEEAPNVTPQQPSEPKPVQTIDHNKIVEQLEADALNLDKSYVAITNCFKCSQKFDVPPAVNNVPKLLGCLHILCSRCTFQSITPSPNPDESSPVIVCPFCRQQTVMKDDKSADMAITDLKVEPLTITDIRKKKASSLPLSAFALQQGNSEGNDYACAKCALAEASGKSQKKRQRGVGKPLKPIHDSHDELDNDGVKSRSSSAAGIRDMISEQNSLNLDDIAHCIECDMIICLHCAVFGTCRSHTMAYVEESANEARDKIRLALTDVKPTLDALVVHKGAVAEAIRVTQAQFNQVRCDVISLFDQLSDLVSFREEELLRELDKMFQLHMRKLQEEKRLVTDNILHTSWAYKYAREVAVAANDVHALGVRHLIFRRLRELSQLALTVEAVHAHFAFTSASPVLPLDEIRALLLETGAVGAEGDDIDSPTIDLAELFASVTGDVSSTSIEVPSPAPGNKPRTRLVRVIRRKYVGEVLAQAEASTAPPSLPLPSAPIDLGVPPAYLLVCVTLLLVSQCLHAFLLGAFGGGGSKEVEDGQVFLALVFLSLSLCVVAATVHDAMAIDTNRILRLRALDEYLDGRRRAAWTRALKAVGGAPSPSSPSPAPAVPIAGVVDESKFTEEVEEFEEPIEGTDGEGGPSLAPPPAASASAAWPSRVVPVLDVAQALLAQVGDKGKVDVRLEEFAQRSASRQKGIQALAAPTSQRSFLDDELATKYQKLRLVAEYARSTTSTASKQQQDAVALASSPSPTVDEQKAGPDATPAPPALQPAQSPKRAASTPSPSSTPSK